MQRHSYSFCQTYLPCSRSAAWSVKTKGRRSRRRRIPAATSSALLPAEPFLPLDRFFAKLLHSYVFSASWCRNNMWAGLDHCFCQTLAKTAISVPVAYIRIEERHSARPGPGGWITWRPLSALWRPHHIARPRRRTRIAASVDCSWSGSLTVGLQAEPRVIRQRYHQRTRAWLRAERDPSPASPWASF